MFTIEIDKKEKIIYIGTENGSGCKYEYKTKEDIKNIINEYITNYVEI